MSFFRVLRCIINIAIMYKESDKYQIIMPSMSNEMWIFNQILTCEICTTVIYVLNSKDLSLSYVCFYPNYSLNMHISILTISTMLKVVVIVMVLTKSSLMIQTAATCSTLSNGMCLYCKRENCQVTWCPDWYVILCILLS